MSEDITEQLETYFKNSKKDLWIGIQNFQGVRQFTKIPLAPLTLIYGQNSAGKSTIHDALEFIHGFFGGNWDNDTTESYLNRWANHKRCSSSPVKGFIGESSDVVISISSYAVDTNYFDWESHNYKNQDFVRDHPLYFFFSDQGVDFKLFLYFSFDNNKRKWLVRKVTLFFGGDCFLEIVSDKSKPSEHDATFCQIKLNKCHLVYDYLDAYFEYKLNELIFGNFEADVEGNWISILKAELSDDLNWKHPFDWYSFDVENYEKLPDSVLVLRSVLLGLIMVPSLSASSRMNYCSIPPLRPIPSKDEAVFRRYTENEHLLWAWKLLAEEVCVDAINKQYPVGINGNENKTEHLDEINRILFHPFFLGTGYEITGECYFLTPLEFLNEARKNNAEMRNLLIDSIDAEIHLKILHKETGNLIEIEDVGVGISQIIPVLVVISCGYKAFIQQPELHLHPKLQAQLADAFIECINKKAFAPSFFVESHSEHFLLRLLRRIRETHDCDIKNKLFSLSSTDVSVLYVDKLTDGSSKIFPLRISPEGEFIDRWPGGFFSDRDRDLGLLDE